MTVPHDARGVVRLVARLQTLHPTLMVVEAAGGLVGWVDHLVQPVVCLGTTSPAARQARRSPGRLDGCPRRGVVACDCTRHLESHGDHQGPSCADVVGERGRGAVPRSSARVTVTL